MWASRAQELGELKAHCKNPNSRVKNYFQGSSPCKLNPSRSSSISSSRAHKFYGHVFQFHFTNSTSMSEYAFVTQNDANWGKNAVRFGFNVSRVFTLIDKKGEKDKLPVKK